MARSAQEYPTVLFPDKTTWAEWLDEHHTTERGVWVRLAKSAANLQTVAYAEAVDVALCYGWIDGQAKRYNDESWIQKFTPRTRRSVWSKRNRERAERLIASSEMRPAGFAAIDAAKADGRWDRAYDSPGTATVPDDLQSALDLNPNASSFFETLNSTNRYAILHRIQTAVKPETRARRIERFIAMLNRGEKRYP